MGNLQVEQMLHPRQRLHRQHRPPDQTRIFRHFQVEKGTEMDEKVQFSTPRKPGMIEPYFTLS